MEKSSRQAIQQKNFFADILSCFWQFLPDTAGHCPDHPPLVRPSFGCSRVPNRMGLSTIDKGGKGFYTIDVRWRRKS